ncbi:MAG: aspartate kinase [Synergistaceae bacterium]|nr:aspartate kinase [Synergistaceae bacterium]
MAKRVFKFGGSSVATADKIRAVARKVAAYVRQGDSIVVVVSAMGKTTDGLIRLAMEVAPSLNRREMDQLLATGEQQTIALLALALEGEGIRSRSFTGSQAGFLVEGHYSEGRIRRMEPQLVERSLAAGEVAVVAGFQGALPNGDTITLGRGGSDLSAIALAASLEADSCHIYTDVDGIYSADPRVVPEARKLDHISYQECLEMAVAGSKVLQSRSVELAARMELPVYVASTFSNEEGTWVMNFDVNEGLVVKAVVSDRETAKVAVLGVPDVPGVAARLFSALADRGVGAEMIIQSVMRGQVNDIGFLVKKSLLGDAIEVCRDLVRDIGAQGVTYDTEIARVSVIGAGIANHPEIPSQMFSILAAEGINLDMIAATSMAITCVVAAPKMDQAVQALHGHFVPDED